MSLSDEHDCLCKGCITVWQSTLMIQILILLQILNFFKLLMDMSGTNLMCSTCVISGPSREFALTPFVPWFCNWVLLLGMWQFVVEIYWCLWHWYCIFLVFTKTQGWKPHVLTLVSHALGNQLNNKNHRLWGSTTILPASAFSHMVKFQIWFDFIHLSLHTIFVWLCSRVYPFMAFVCAHWTFTHAWMQWFLLNASALYVNQCIHKVCDPRDLCHESWWNWIACYVHVWCSWPFVANTFDRLIRHLWFDYHMSMRIPPSPLFEI